MLGAGNVDKDNR